MPTTLMRVVKRIWLGSVMNSCCKRIKSTSTRKSANTGDGGDTITTGTGDDHVIGGGAGDTVTAGAGNNVVIGDSGSYNGAKAESASQATDGADTITTTGGNDTVIGGGGGD